MAQNDTEISREDLYEALYNLRKENAQLKRSKKFGLVFEQKPDAQVMRVHKEIPVLREDTSRAVVTDESGVNHILINGDNFHALTALRATHANRVDVIYIDPPYNTGNKDFIYNDNYLDREDGYRHSKWLSFMDKRLRLAHELLSETGVIFVSIDDNEQARLKLLMDDVFEPENLVSTLVWQKKSGGGMAKYTYEGHEYVFAYAKNKFLVGSLTETDENDSRYPTIEIEGKVWGYTDDFLRATHGKYESGTERRLHYEDILEAKGQAKMDEVDEQLGQGNYILLDSRTSPGKHYVARLFDPASKRKIIYSIIQKLFTAIGSNQLETILGSKKFDNPKPVELIKKIVDLTNNRNAIVLDFFAGSGTTAHAVAELNKEDGGRRQCILVTDGGKTEESGESSKNAKGDEVNIAEEITYERVRRVLTGKDWADGKEHEPLGGNLRYFNVELHDVQGATKMDKEQLVEYVTTDHASILGNAFTTVEEMDVFDDELWLHKTYKVFSAPTSAEGVLRYVVGVSRHDFELAELRDYLTSLPTETEVILVGNNLDRIAWVKENLEKYKVVNLMDSVIESHHWVKTVLLHDH